jgi:hypothetical protein
MRSPTVFSTLLIAVLLIYARPASAAFQADFLKLSKPLYKELPDIGACRGGLLHEAEKQRVKSGLNDIRQRHGLAPIGRELAAEPAVTQAALMLAGNGQLTHNPPASWRCYSAEGAGMVAKSLLSGGLTAPNIAFHTPVQDIVAWLTDVSAVESETVSHRRILLDPFLANVAYGRVSGKVSRRNAGLASVLKVSYAKTAGATESMPQLIAYPYHDYPLRYFAEGAILSLSLLIDASRKSANAEVDFSGARISVNTGRGKSMAVRNIRFDNHYFGLPNNLQFKLPDLAPNVRYEVRIDGVRVRGAVTSFHYWFRITPDADDRA